MRGMILHALIAGTALTSGVLVPATAHAQASYNFKIASQDLGKSLREVARRTGTTIVFEPSSVRGKTAPGVTGTYSVREAIERLIAGTGLSARQTSGGSWIVAVAQAADAEPADGLEEDERGRAEILVVGSRSQNADIKRTENDPQPYVVFDQKDLRDSGTANLDDFFRMRLPQNAQAIGTNQVETAGNQLVANQGQINLRGLGTNQTLILVDGRRLPGVSTTEFGQPNINGIPFGAIERIEVLPSTAGAIYGGSAVGGVVNIILKRDYAGIEAQLDYGNTFDGKTGDFKASVVGGFRLGSTRIMLTAARARTSDMQAVDRPELIRRARAMVLANNPGAITALTATPDGATPNFCASLATGTGRCNGVLLTLDNGIPYNASYGYIPYGYRGPVATGDGGAALLATAGKYNFEYPESWRTGLVQGSQSDSLGLNIRQPVTDRLELYADGAWDRARGAYDYSTTLITLLQANDPANPFQQAIRVTVPLQAGLGRGSTSIENLRINGGAIVRLPHNWSASLESGWGRSISSQLLQQKISNATLRAAIIPYATSDLSAVTLPDFAPLYTDDATAFGPARTSLFTSSIRLGGPLFKLPAGAMTLTLLGERRVQKIAERIDGIPTSNLFIVSPARRQAAKSLYAETRVPLVSAANAMPLIHDLELQGSLRYDDYVSLGTTSSFVIAARDAAHPAAVYSTNKLNSLDFLVGGRYSPVDGVILRASYSTGFLPPGLTQLSSSTSVIRAGTGTAVALDPKRGNTNLIGDASGNVTGTTGGNPNLQPESSRSLSYGIVLEPKFVPGLRLSADYTEIRKTGEITNLPLQTMINNEALFPSRITRGAPLAGDPVGYAGPIIAYDLSAINVANTEVRAWDFQIDYRFELGRFGRFHPYAIGTHQLAFQRVLQPGQPAISYLDYVNGPLRWRGNIGLDWSLGRVSAGWNLQYYDSYRICNASDTVAACNTRILNQGGSRVPSQSYQDVFIRYAFPKGGSLLSGLELSAGVQNLWNKLPPPIAQLTAATGTYSRYGDPRLRRFTLSLRKRVDF